MANCFQSSRKARGGLIAAIALVVAGCASAPGNPAQSAWIAARDRQPLEFTVPADQSDAAWARAQEWVARFALLPIQVATDTLIQTAVGPQEFDARPELSITRSRLPDGSAIFRFQGRVQNPLAAGDLRRQLHACAYFAASGIPYPG